jgi:hypothetical protein
MREALGSTTSTAEEEKESLYTHGFSLFCSFTQNYFSVFF